MQRGQPALITEGQELVRQCVRRDRPGRYQIQAAISAVHSAATTVADTDWPGILRLYDHLLALERNPVVALNRAVVVAEIDGPAAALSLLDDLDLGAFYLFHAVRADLLRRVDRPRDAADAYRAALALTANTAEQSFLRRRLRTVASGSGS